ncbi:MarR family transcriptional regulator [Nocardia sp. CC201C]|uniref:MarR family winged helix-turn-helix transcriptional regulator n=1 Tax=Nocardia sp. CC201C TaxID=3044575 RepID=UPI0024A9F588|nr:MarR family transcriptional regulator [Nocardia sp. CC201C]
MTPIGDPHDSSVRDLLPGIFAELEDGLAAISQLLTRVRRHNAIVAQTGVRVDRAGISVLRVLRTADGPIRLGDLAFQLGVEPPHVSRQIRLLHQDGLIERIADRVDHRSQRVSLSAAGRVAIDSVRTAGSSRLAQELRNWDVADLKLLIELNSRLVIDVGKRNGSDCHMGGQ